MPAFDKRVECRKELADVVEMKAGGGLVEDEKDGLRGFGGKERRQLDALTLAAAERARRLSELDVTQAHVLQRLEPLHDALFDCAVGLRKELNGLIDCHFKNIVDVGATVTDFEHLVFEAAAVTAVAFEHYVGHELHFDFHHALALALLAPPALGIERKGGLGVAVLLGQLLAAQQSADVVVGLHVGGRIGARALANRVLIHKFDIRNT